MEVVGPRSTALPKTVEAEPLSLFESFSNFIGHLDRFQL